MFIHKTAKFAPVWTNIRKIQAIIVHQPLSDMLFLFCCAFSHDQTGVLSGLKIVFQRKQLLGEHSLIKVAGRGFDTRVLTQSGTVVKNGT